MTGFVPAPEGPASLCQRCWSLVPSSAIEDHARWHESVKRALDDESSPH